MGPDLKRGSLYSDYSPTTAPPRPPAGKRSSVNGHVNPGLSLRENIVTMNPLYEGQVVEHKDLAAMNCSDFGVHPGEQIVPDGVYDNNITTQKACMIFILLTDRRLCTSIHLIQDGNN